jgi:hypothetical protein
VREGGGAISDGSGQGPAHKEEVSDNLNLTGEHGAIRWRGSPWEGGSGSAAAVWSNIGRRGPTARVL